MTIRIDGNNTTANPGITGGDADTGLQFGTDEVKVVTGGSDRMTVNSAGNVGIGTTSPQAISGYTVLTLNNDTQGGVIEFKKNNTSYGRLLQGSSAVILETKQSIPLILNTNDTERMRVLPTGGMTFNGDTAQANALDDYEEGTFTPVIQGGTTAGSYTPSSQLGLYTKIGRTVTVHLSLVNITVVTNGSGPMLITGFPFTSTSTNIANFTGSVRFDRVDFSSPTKYAVAVMSQSQSRIGFQQVYDDDGDIGVTVNSGILQSGASDIFASISYIVD
jgi:hypothetical protein